MFTTLVELWVSSVAAAGAGAGLAGSSGFGSAAGAGAAAVSAGVSELTSGAGSVLASGLSSTSSVLSAGADSDLASVLAESVGISKVSSSSGSALEVSATCVAPADAGFASEQILRSHLASMKPTVSPFFTCQRPFLYSTSVTAVAGSSLATKSSPSRALKSLARSLSSHVWPALKGAALADTGMAISIAATICGSNRISISHRGTSAGLQSLDSAPPH